jgi:outer membrane protein OmpA-like peptidoglycan-associated protein
LLLQRFAEDQTPSTVPAIVEEVLRSPGLPLEAGARDFMESRFQRSFADVRIHADGRAAQSAKAIGAQAYTVGRDIVFGAGRYRPTQPDGRRLLAHELTHAAQQQGLARSIQAAPLIAGGPEGSASEAEAEAASDSIAAGRRVTRITALSTSAVQRQPAETGDPALSAPPTDQGAEVTLTRSEERKRSESSPGEITGSAEPMMISLYNFAIDQATLKPEHKAALKELATLIKTAKRANVEIFMFGHTDSSGEPDVNNPISKRRAMAVRKALQQQAGVPVRISWAGEDQPAVPNDTVDGRSRNRRVDIYFLPKKSTRIKTKENPTGDPDLDIIIIYHIRRKKKVIIPDDKGKEPEPEDDEPEQDEEEEEEEEEEEDDDDDDDDDNRPFFDPDLCAGIMAYVCGAAGLFGAKKLFCMYQPEICELIDWITEDDDDDDDDDDDEPDDEPEEEKERIACPLAVELPRPGVHRIPASNFPYLKVNPPLRMRVEFNQENPDHSPYCDCNCGEFRQYVKGYFDSDHGTGVMRRDPHAIANGQYMHRDIFLEDGFSPHYDENSLPIRPDGYGHRYLNDMVRSFSKPDAAQFLAPNLEGDSFLPTRQDGCTYKGMDAPGVFLQHEHRKDPRTGEYSNEIPNAEVHLHMWFRAGPVDACHADREIGQWHEWEVVCDRYPEPDDDDSGQVPPKYNPARPYFGGAIGDPVVFVYNGGLYTFTQKNSTTFISIRFRSEGNIHTSSIEVFVADVTDAGIRFVTTNDKILNVAPPGNPPLVIQPFTPGWVPKSVL